MIEMLRRLFGKKKRPLTKAEKAERAAREILYGGKSKAAQWQTFNEIHGDGRSDGDPHTIGIWWES